MSVVFRVVKCLQSKGQSAIGDSVSTSVEWLAKIVLDLQTNFASQALNTFCFEVKFNQKKIKAT